ncbi:MAG TPA: PEP/pyruvate-binding domain-containing protein, partial [Dehalococcoidia bacterium]|nr:PEP/pyruvate-binding domain-containing protein [Dehalococcoidia bacterium]
VSSIHEMKPVAWFADVGKADVDIAGGKGANLGELARAGLPVPPGFIAITAAYRAFLDAAGLIPQIGAHLATLDVTNPQQLQVACVAVRQLVEAAPVPPDIASAVLAAHRDMGAPPVAVRSSATAEDLAEASFAGQQSTFLNVTADHLVDAVRDCWASLFEPQAVAYRHRRGIEHLDVSIAVVVQRMVQSQRSGVIFTVHPVTGDRDSIVIEAVLGLGEAAVSGVVTPDLYVVRKSDLTIEERNVSHQDRQLVRSESSGPGEENNTWVPIPAPQASAQKLSDTEITRLAGIARRVEKHYGSPQDIEWAEEAGEFFVVQARPVTTI